MIIKHQFVIKEHEDFGSVGLRMKGRPHFDPFEGMGTAHDVLEHFTDDDGSVEHELMALGASIFVRDCGEYFRQKGRYNASPGYQISGDMIEQCRYMEEQGRTSLRDPGRTQALWDIEGHHCAEDEVQRAYAESVRTLRAEYADREEGPSYYAWIQHDERAFVGWLRRGYRRARRRYRGMEPYHVCLLFSEVEKQVDDFLKNYSELLGAEVTISVDTRRERVSVELEEEY